MQLVRDGDHAALHELYRRHSRRILYYLSTMLRRDEERARDLLQDLFLRIVERPDLYDETRPFVTWLFSCAWNLCKNEYRWKSLRNDEAMDEEVHGIEPPDIEHRLDMEEFRKVLDDELATLSVEHRTAFHLRYVEELSLQDIADALDIPLGTVKSRLFTTQRRLADRLHMYDPRHQPTDLP